MAWLKTEAMIGGRKLPVMVKTIKGKPVRLESSKLHIIGEPVLINKQRFTVSAVTPAGDGFRVALEPAKIIKNDSKS